jgi:hypothetical protein
MPSSRPPRTVSIWKAGGIAGQIVWAFQSALVRGDGCSAAKAASSNHGLYSTICRSNCSMRPLPSTLSLPIYHYTQARRFCWAVIGYPTCAGRHYWSPAHAVTAGRADRNLKCAIISPANGLPIL